MTARRLNPSLVLVLVALGATGQAFAAESLYRVAKVRVDVAAEDAVVARAQGLAQAERRATEILLQRIVPLNLQAQLPALSPGEIQAIVIGVVVRKERTSATRYIASLDVQFDEPAVKQLLAGYAIPASEDRAPTISILPLVLAGDSVADERDVGWLRAWEGLDLTHSVVPATLVRPRADLGAAAVRGALAGDVDALASFRTAYGYGGLVIAVGEMGDGRFRVRLAGDDAVGDVDFDETYPANAVGDAAAAAFAELERRWKTAQQGGALAEHGGLGQPATRRDGPFHERNLLESTGRSDNSENRW